MTVDQAVVRIRDLIVTRETELRRESLTRAVLDELDDDIIDQLAAEDPACVAEREAFLAAFRESLTKEHGDRADIAAAEVRTKGRRMICEIAVKE